MHIILFSVIIQFYVNQNNNMIITLEFEYKKKPNYRLN